MPVAIEDDRLGEPDDLSAARRHPEPPSLPGLVQLLEAADVLEDVRCQPRLCSPAVEQLHRAPFDRRERRNVSRLGETNLVFLTLHLISLIPTRETYWSGCANRLKKLFAFQRGRAGRLATDSTIAR